MCVCVINSMVMNMKLVEIRNRMKRKYPNRLIIVKYGNFYRVFDEDMVLMWYFTRYQVVDNQRLGFPSKVLDDVLLMLQEENIHYIVYYDKEHIVQYMNDKNQYESLLKVARETFNREKRIRNLLTKIEQQIKLESQLEYYEKCCERVSTY